jgi:hypothetical protein
VVWEDGGSNPASYPIGIISGLDLREPLHADCVDLRDPVLESGAFNLIPYLAIAQGPFNRDELPFWRVLANFEIEVS